MTVHQALPAVRIRLSDKAHMGDLRAYLESVRCSVRVVGQVTLDVSPPRAPSDSQALREVANHLKVWQAMNPDAIAHIVGEGIY